MKRLVNRPATGSAVVLPVTMKLIRSWYWRLSEVVELKVLKFNCELMIISGNFLTFTMFRRFIVLMKKEINVYFFVLMKN